MLIYAGQQMADDVPLGDYHVPPARNLRRGARACARRKALSAVCARWVLPQGCKCMIAIDRRKLENGKPDPDSAYWN